MQDIEQLSDQGRLLDHWREQDSAPAKETRLTDMQKEFALQLVVNGGNALEAAAAAGYQFPEVASTKLLLNFGVVHMVNRLTVEIWKGKLPALLANLHGIAFNPKATDRARVDATNSLLDRLGATVPKGPSTAIQINTGNGSGELQKGQAQVIISELWTAREERQRMKDAARDAGAAAVERDRSRKASDIPATMSDNSDDPALALLEHIAHGDPADGMGGGDFSGAPAAASSIPAPPSTREKNLSYGGNENGNEEQRSVIWSEIAETAPARSGETGGFGGGEGAGGEVRDGADVVGAVETRAHAGTEVFRRLDACDDAGSLSDVAGDVAVADAHASSDRREGSGGGEFEEAGGRASGSTDFFADD